MEASEINFFVKGCDLFIKKLVPLQLFHTNDITKEGKAWKVREIAGYYRMSFLFGKAPEVVS